MQNQDNCLRETHLVTGGGGYAGYRLGLALSKKGHKVIILDVRQPSEELNDSMQFVQADIINYSEVEAALSGVHCVYHLASYGMSGREQLNRSLIERVNVEGTKNVIKACIAHNIPRLVYTSTFNVVFGGQEIQNGTEELPYFPLEKHPDYYSRTKAVAEQEVLSHNGHELAGGGVLRCCALRLAGVYGPGEQRHLPRIVGYIEAGMFRFVYGSADSLVEFLHVDNLVQAHVLAGEGLSDTNNRVAAGQKYFVSDGKPVNNFQFFKPLIEGLGYKYPTMKLPISLIYLLAFLTEWCHYIVGRIYNFQPFLTRTEVFKTGVTHWFCLDKIKRELGYRPSVQNDLSSTVEWFLSHGHGRNRLPPKYGLSQFLKDVFLALLFAMIIMSFLPSVW